MQEITTRIKRMNVERETTSYGIMTKVDYTTTLELEGSIPIDPTRPIIISQEEPTNE